MKHPFVEELSDLLNKYSKENDSDTPDYILANYISRCLDTFSKTVAEREQWYGRPLSKNQVQEVV